MVHCIAVYVFCISLKKCIDFALSCILCTAEANCAAVTDICILQACCRSAGCVYIHLQMCRPLMGQMFVWSAHSRVPLLLTQITSSSRGASDPSYQGRKRRWVCVCFWMYVCFGLIQIKPASCVRELPPPQPTERSQWVIMLPTECPRQTMCVNVESIEKENGAGPVVISVWE